MLFKYLLAKHILFPLAAVVILVPLILNFGFGYIDTIDRVGNGEDVTSQEIMDAGTKGIKPGETSKRVEELLGMNAVPVESKNAGETCRGYPIKGTPTQMVVCYNTAGSGDEARWRVSSARVGVR